MDLAISPIQCGNRNCIGVIGKPYPQIPKAQIVIEDTWDVGEDQIENSIVGLISHETVEYLLLKLEPRLLSDLHAIVGHGQEIQDYMENTDGIVLGKCAVKPHYT